MLPHLSQDRGFRSWSPANAATPDHGFIPIPAFATAATPGCGFNPIPAFATAATPARGFIPIPAFATAATPARGFIPVLAFATTATSRSRFHPDPGIRDRGDARSRFLPVPVNGGRDHPDPRSSTPSGFHTPCRTIPRSDLRRLDATVPIVIRLPLTPEFSSGMVLFLVLDVPRYHIDVVR